MKKRIISMLALLLMAAGMNAQENRKDTVKTDSTHMEKIRKMPMDTTHYKTPVKPVLPEEQKDKDKDKEQPIIAPSDKKHK
ncbi:MAG: hypothetical protein JWO44_2416 [Bacteroidetes bacterium]|nr:hypothetical protein [Bacteroidota bacterium]